MENTKGTSTFQSLLNYICQLEKEKVRLYRQEMKKMPKGSLYINKSNGSIYYECALNGQRRIINRDIDLIYKLARKKYLTLKLREYEERFIREGKLIRANTNDVSAKIRKLLIRYGDMGLDVMRVTCSVEQYRWAHANYYQNPLNQEDRIYSTYSDIKVRSKSEQRIGNELELNGVPYRYEQRICVNVSWMEGVFGCAGTGEKDYYPDFTIMTATGELLLWEHLGRVDAENYRRHNAEKICAYRQGKGIKDEMLILTFESDLKEAGRLEVLIARRVLPYI